MTTTKRLTFIDLFAGVGGFHLAMKPFADCVFASEWNKEAQQTYLTNHGDCLTMEFHGDIEAVPSYEIPDHDILCGGFPCQPYSTAGKQEGKAHPQGQLIFKIIDILRTKKPSVIFLENVTGLLTENEGKTLYDINKELLMSLGYKVKTAVFNAFDYGDLPQNRERVFIVGFLDIAQYHNFDFQEPVELTTQLFGDIINIHEKADDDRLYMTDMTSRPQREMHEYGMEQYKIYQSRPLAKVKKGIDDETLGIEEPEAPKKSGIREHKTPNQCPCLTANMGRGGHNVPLIRDDFGIRKLSPRECFLIQGFPPEFKFPEIMAKGHLYMQAGNSIPLGVVSRIAQNIATALDAEPYRYITEEVDEEEAEAGRFTASYLDKDLYQYQIIGWFDSAEEAEAFCDSLPEGITDQKLFEYHKIAMKEYFNRNQ